jgi:uncharacterized membrane protein
VVKKKNIKPLAIAVTLLVIVIIGIFNIHYIKDRLHAWKVLPEPERLTELYFTHPNNLPTTYTPNQSQTVSFTVHNLEYRTTDYKYEIIESNNNLANPNILTSNNFILKQNEYRKLNVNIHTLDLGQRVNLKVELVNVNESVDYWLKRGE